jgi:hypothetical protein
MFMDLSIVGITQNDDGTMSFRTLAEQEIKDAIITQNIQPTTATGIYTLDGRYIGTDLNVLKHGMYVVNGRKIVK